MTQINGFKGFVGYGLRELNPNETEFYCLNSKNKISLSPQTQNRVNFTSDLMLRSYTSGCYYYDTETGKWSSNGMDIYEDSNFEMAHCVSNHLTLFACGLVLCPSKINYQYPYVFASITRNSIVYSTVTFFLCIYVFLAIWSRFMDRRDEKKQGIYLLKDNYPNDFYFYELIVFTGNRNESETKSKVFNFYVIFYSNMQTFSNYFNLKKGVF
jgi:hypothetical protein